MERAARTVYDDARASSALLTEKDGTVIFRFLAATPSTLLLTAFLAHAQPASNTVRSAAFSHAAMRSILRGMRLEFTERPSGDSIAFDFQLNCHKVTLLNHIKEMQLSACFDGIGDLMKMNQWSREHFFTRAYIDEQGCSSLGSDVHFSGGVTRAMIEDWVREFGTAVTVYARFVAELPPFATTPAPAPAVGEQPAPDRPAWPVGTMAWSQSCATRSVPGLLRINRNITLKYDPDKWTQTPSYDAGQFALAHSSGNGHALVIAERIAVPIDSVEEVALANAQFADPRAKVVFRHKRGVNGVDVWFLKIEAEVGTVPMVYCGYYYADQSSTVQVVTYTTKTLLPEFENDFMEFLNGLTVSK
jgi:hypothetical protein